MKKFSKIFMIVACLAMVFCFSAGAFAANTGTATLTITVNGVDKVTAADISGNNLKEAIDTLAEEKTDMNPVWNTVTGWPDTSVTHYALNELYGYATTYETCDKLPNSEFTSKITNKTYKVTDEMAVTGYKGYYKLGERDTGEVDKDGNPIIEYHYLYIGSGWTYHVAGSDAEIYDYMCCYPLNGQHIQLEYRLTPTDWITTDPLV